MLNIIKDFYCDFKNYSSKSDILSSVDIQKLKIKQCSDLLRQYGLQKKVIVAGSTGSVNYMKDFMGVIHSSKNGYIVTSGVYDRKTDKLSEKDPAFLLHDLLTFLKVDEGDVQNIVNPEVRISPDERFDLLANHVLDDDFNGKHLAVEKKEVISRDFDENFSIFQAKNEIQEAEMVANWLTNLHDCGDLDGGKKVSIICPNMNLMVLIKRFLQKSDLAFNDYEKSSLLDLEFAKLFLLIARSIDENMNSVSILAILKSNLIDKCKDISLVHEFEQEIIRSYRSSSDIADLLKLLEERIDNVEDEPKDNKGEGLKLKDFTLITQILIDVHEIYRGALGSNIFDIFSKITDVVLKITEKSLTDFFNEDQLEQFNQIQQALDANSDIKIIKNEIHDFFSKIFSFAGFSRDSIEGCNIEISTSIEARLINYDLMFFTGLNKANYPTLEKDSWLSGKIRKDLGVFNNDKKTSLAGYDFCNLLSNKKVILSYSNFINGSKAAKSPFLMKLETVLKKNDISLVKFNENSDETDVLHDGDMNLTKDFVSKSPEINLSDHINSFAASDIDVISSSPYSFYAKKILKLKRGKEIDFAPGNAEFGTFMHKLVEKIAVFKSDEGKDSNRKTVLNKLFSSFYKCKESKLVWLPRAQKIVENFVNDNEQFLRVRAENNFERSVCGKFSDFTIKAKIDRVHIDDFDEISIIDYKTGTIPSIKDVRMHKKSQLLIYALLLQRSDIELKKSKYIKLVQYWKLSANKDTSIKKMIAEDGLVKSIQEIECNLDKLMKFFKESKVRFNCIEPDKFRDEYFHLSRIGKF